MKNKRLKEYAFYLQLSVRVLFIIFTIGLVGVMLFNNTSWVHAANGMTGLHRIYINGDYVGAVDDVARIEEYFENESNYLEYSLNLDQVKEPENIKLVYGLTNESEKISLSSALSSIREAAVFTTLGYELQVDGVPVLKALRKNDIENGIQSLIETFAGVDKYANLLAGTTYDYSEYGRYLEDAYISNSLYIEQTAVPIEEALVNPNEIAEFLLYGHVGDHNIHTVTLGETLPEIAEMYKLNVSELLVANPQLFYNEETGEQSLLAIGDEIIVDLIDSQVEVVVEMHEVVEEVMNYKTQYVSVDYMTVGYEKKVQSGSDGMQKATYNLKVVNGQIIEYEFKSSEVLVEAQDEIYHQGNVVNPYIGNPKRWRWPALGTKITSGYGYRWGKLHAGIDIAGSYYGSPIYAANNGYVEDIYYDGYGGWQVKINHGNGYKTVYAHLASNPAKFVYEGMVVKPGTIIGGMGATGRVTGKHLHFEIWKNGVRVNPSPAYFSYYYN